MNENCNDCRPAMQCANNERDIAEIKRDLADLAVRLAKLETSTAVNEEQTKMVFKILNEIKDSIALISSKIDVLEKKPGDRWENLIKTVITVVATAAMTYFISRR